MNLRSCKVLKSFSILLLLMEFLTPTFVSDLLPSEKSDPFQQRILHIAKQRNPILFFNEEADNEERQRESKHSKVSPLFTKPALAHEPILYVNRESTWTLLAHNEKHYDTHPPLFTLHRHLLI